MAAGERARRRAEREQQAAAAEAARRAEAERQARRTARLDRLTRWWPGPSGSAGQSGTLAARRRQQVGLVVAFVVALNVLVWLATDEWAARVFFLLLCVLVAPIATTLLTRK